MYKVTDEKIEYIFDLNLMSLKILSKIKKYFVSYFMSVISVVMDEFSFLKY